jgi:hypothetical protein
MPLIEVKDFATTAQFQEHLIQITIPDLIDTWEESTPYQIFINRYKCRLIQSINYNPLSNKTGKEAQELLYQHIYELNNGRSNIGLNYNFKIFIEEEQRFLMNSPDLNLTIKQVVIRDAYLNFLNENNEKLRRTSNLSNKIFYDAPKLSERLSTLSKASLLQLRQCDVQIKQLFRELDAISEVFEKSFKEEEEEPKQVRESFPNMDWSYFTNPFQLDGYPDATKEFIRAIIVWFREKMYDRKKRLYWKRTPNTYLLIEEYIEELKQEVDPPKQMQETENKATAKEFMSAENYPRSIFVSQTYYNFFCLLADQATNLKQLSFIFRQMSEKEQPKMIVVKDKQFRDWFNDQPFYIKLDEATSTYPNAKNEDRLWAYNTAKNLYFNES